MDEIKKNIYQPNGTWMYKREAGERARPERRGRSRSLNHESDQGVAWGGVRPPFGRNLTGMGRMKVVEWKRCQGSDHQGCSKFKRIERAGAEVLGGKVNSGG